MTKEASKMISDLENYIANLEARLEQAQRLFDALSFGRKVENLWINPKKCEKQYEWMKRDNSPAGLYPAIIIPETHLHEVVLIIRETEAKMIEKILWGGGKKQT